MNFDDLKEQFKDKFDEFMARLEDSATYNTLREKFQNLNPNVQKAINVSVILLVTLFTFSCLGPLGYYQESSQLIAEYQGDEEEGIDGKLPLLRDLLKASSLANQTSAMPQDINIDQLISQVNAKIDNARLLPEQKAGVSPSDAKSFGGPLGNPSISRLAQEGVEVKVKKINLTQFVKLAYDFQSLNPAVKLAGFDLVATPDDDHYYDANFRIIKFAPPKAPEPKEEPRRRRGRKGGDDS